MRQHPQSRQATLSVYGGPAPCVVAKNPDTPPGVLAQPGDANSTEVVNAFASQAAGPVLRFGTFTLRPLRRSALGLGTRSPGQRTSS